MDILATISPQTIDESNQQLADEITLLAGQSNVADTIRSSTAAGLFTPGCPPRRAPWL
jgi:hypothetical protein